MDDEKEVIPVEVFNGYGVNFGRNLPNHSSALIGRATFVRTSNSNVIPLFRTKQAAFRHAAWIVSLAELLPDEEGKHNFEEILEAIRNT